MARKTKGRIFKRGQTWCLDYQVNGKRIRTVLRKPDGEPVTDKEEAELAADTELRPVLAKDKVERRRLVSNALATAEDKAREAERAAQERQDREDAERNKLPIAAAWDRYPYTENTRGSVTRQLSPRTIRDNASHWKVFADWAAEQDLTALEDIRPDHVPLFSRYLRDRMTANRHNKIMFTCSVVCRLSGRPDHFADSKRYRSEPVHRENLEPEEIRKVIDASSGELRRLFIVAAFTGLRLGDCATLQWSDIRIEADGGRIIRKTGKTRKTVRFPIHPELLAELERTPPKERVGDVCPELAATYRRDPVRLSVMTRRVFESCGLTTRAKDKAGRAATASVRGFHSFRHSFVTECARGGVPLGLVKEWLGHSSPEITRIYENWNIDRDADRILKALPSVSLPQQAGGSDTPTTVLELGMEEPERDRLARLAGSLPIAKVREILAFLDAGK